MESIRSLVEQELKLLCAVVISKDHLDKWQIPRSSSDMFSFRKAVNCERDLLSRDGLVPTEKTSSWMTSQRYQNLSALQTEWGRSFGASAEATGAGFMGVGIAAVSAHVQHSIDQEESKEEDNRGSG